MANNKGGIRIKRHSIKDANIYEVWDYELNEIQKGGNANDNKNLCITFFSLVIGAILPLFTSKFNNEFSRFLFLAIIVFLSFLGIVFLILWLRSRKNNRELLQTIRSRKVIDDDA